MRPDLRKGFPSLVQNSTTLTMDGVLSMSWMSQERIATGQVPVPVEQPLACKNDVGCKLRLLPVRVAGCDPIEVGKRPIPIEPVCIKQTIEHLLAERYRDPSRPWNNKACLERVGGRLKIAARDRLHQPFGHFAHLYMRERLLAGRDIGCCGILATNKGDTGPGDADFPVRRSLAQVIGSARSGAAPAMAALEDVQHRALDRFNPWHVCRTPRDQTSLVSAVTAGELCRLAQAAIRRNGDTGGVSEEN